MVEHLLFATFTFPLVPKSGLCRDPNGENVSSISDERGSSMFDMVQKKGKDAEMPSLSLEG